jgi:beta-glucosidase
MRDMGFPEGFLWGTAASSTQTEGAAPRSDWYRWEREGRAPLSGNGNGFGTNYKDDFRQLADHRLLHHRLSLEWARLEPDEGKHDGDAVEHCTEILRAAQAAGIQIWACLHHFTLPGWFGEDEGGFVDERARSYYWARHVDWVGETFGDMVYGWKPINEPTAYALTGFRFGVFPPGTKSAEGFAAALEAIHLASFDACRLLRSGGKPIATIENMTPMFPVARTRDPGEWERAEARAQLYDDSFWCGLRAVRDGVLAVPGRAPLDVPDVVDTFDYIGFSYYMAQAVYADGNGSYPLDARRGPLGYAPWSEGLGIVLRRIAEELPGRPILVDECGLGTSATKDSAHDADDEWRVSYLTECLNEVERAIADGIDIRGFFHWTAVDNYEWLEGYDARFGLFDRDRNPKPSAALARRYATGEESSP